MPDAAASASGAEAERRLFRSSAGPSLRGFGEVEVEVDHVALAPSVAAPFSPEG